MAMELHEVFCYPVDPVKPRQDATVIHEYPFGNVQNQMHPNDAEDDQCSDSFERMYTKSFDPVISDSQGVLLEAPELPLKKSRQRFDSYKLGTYIDLENGQYYKKGITRSVQFCTILGMVACWWMSLNCCFSCFTGMSLKQ